MAQDDRNHDSLAELGVDEEERLHGLFRACLDRQCEGVVSHERSVHDEVASIEERVVVAGDIEVRPMTLVPLRDRLVERDGESTDPTLEPRGMSVMESQNVAVHIHVAVVSLGYDERNALVVGEPISERGVHQPFEAISSFRRHTEFLRHAAMVAAVARDDQLEVAVVEDVLDTGHQVALSFQHSVDRAKAVALEQFLVDAPTDEVAQKGEDQRVDFRRMLFFLHELEAVPEEPTHAFFADLLVELVESIDLLCRNHFLDVPVARHENRGRLRLFALSGADREVAIGS